MTSSLYRPRLCEFIIIIGFICLLLSPWSDAEAEKRKRKIHRPVRVTSETTPITSIGISYDEKWLVCATAKAGFTDLWLYSADPKKFILPRRLTDDSSVEAYPAFSRDGTLLAFEGNGYDVKGDIYLLDMNTGNPSPLRLTDRKTGDGAPVFGPSGNKLYFHQIPSGNTNGRLVSLDLETKKTTLLNIDGDGMFPSVSPDGGKICFVSYRNDVAGDIYIYELDSGKVYPVTQGPFLDFSPSWTSDGHAVVFSRIAYDTNQDGSLSLRDRPGLYIVDLQQKNLRPYPLTMLDDTAFNPIVRRQHLFYISRERGTNNCVRLPVDGVISRQSSKAEQTALVDIVAERIPYNPFLTLLACYKVMQCYPDKDSVSAAYRAGGIFEDLGLPEAADIVYGDMINDFPDAAPYTSLAKIRQIMIQAITQITQTPQKNVQRRIIDEALASLEQLRNVPHPEVRARSLIESARLLTDAGRDAKSLLNAVNLLDQVSRDTPELRSENAEALIMKADIYGKIGRSKEIYAIYMSMIKAYADQTKWADDAVNKIIEHRLVGMNSTDTNDKIRYLRKIAEDNKESAPILSMGALNRVGDLYYADNRLTQAKTAYMEVIREFPALNTQTAAARFSLAEILYQEERFKMALDLYEKEINLRPYRDRIHRLARRGYIRKSAAAGEFLFRLGEVNTAQSKFRELIDYDDSIVEAHRGYIKCAAALGNIDKVLTSYRERLQQEPDNAVMTYCTALCLTYLNTRASANEARGLLQDAINLNGQIEFFHQTLGYVLEVFETVYHESGNLETALESYKKAYFLNDPLINPENRAHLMLNIGNIYFIQKQYNQAFTFYSQRESSDVAFDHHDTEILFLTRLGISAFHTRNNARAEEIFNRAIDMISSVTAPQKASDAFDKLHRYIMDRVIIPAIENPELKATALKLSKQQTELHQDLSRVSDTIHPPPSEAWTSFKKGILRLLSHQEKIVPKMVDLARAFIQKDASSGLSEDRVSQDVTFLISQVRKALKDPERLIELKVQTMERLGLVYQEEQKWENALTIFQDVYAVNDMLGLTQNLAKNKRSIAYNQYMLARNVQGEKRADLLRNAADNFQQTIALIDQYGVAKREKEKDRGLVDISLDVALDDASGTQAAEGFSKDQEKRLCEAFVSRISIELDEINAAETAIKRQVALYPAGTEITPKDMYGVSLLFHRAGLIYAAREMYPDALAYFRRSADITRKITSPVGTALNVTNMTHVLQKMTPPSDGPSSYPGDIESFDTDAAELLSNPGFPDFFQQAMYHNQMGVFYSTRYSRDAVQDAAGTVMQMTGYGKAMAHFSKAADILKKTRRPDRETHALTATLNLNMAQISLDLSEPGHAETFFRAAFYAADKGLLPDLRWRAESGLHRYDDALETLNWVLFFRASCGPFEIMDAFSPVVADMIEKGDVEAAFNLVETLSEHERFHRTGFLLQGIETPEITLCQKAYPRLLRIRKLRADLAAAEDDDKTYVSNMILQEQDLLDKTLGRSGENLSDLMRSVPSADIRNQVIILIGLAADAEDKAAEIAKNQNPENTLTLVSAYDKLIEQFASERQEIMGQRPEDHPCDILTLFGPEPFEAMDVMDLLPEGGRLIRLYAPANQKGLYAFTVTRDDISVSRYAGIDDVLKTLPDDVPVYIAYELPEKIDKRFARVLSGTHFVRSVLTRKPFKRSIVTVSGAAVSGSEMPFSAYESVSFQSRETLFSHSAAPVLAQAHTLLLEGDVTKSMTVPTRPGETPKTFLSLSTRKGERIRMDRLLARTAGLSLAVIIGAMPDVYVTGHLFSIFGCPTVIHVPTTDAGGVAAFLDKYKNTTPYDALLSSETVSAASSGLLGYRGMTPEEAEEFSRTRFAAYVQKGRAAFDKGAYIQALAMFENAINIIIETQTYENLLAALYQYARESAYRFEDYETSAAFAERLVALMDTQSPDTEAHAQALLQYGIILSRLERYDKAVPAIEASVEILENLELDNKTIYAMSNLGIVLENATEYDRALDFFNSAADISMDLDQRIILAGQYDNMGRIYDLRLSNYPLAIRNYRKAYDIYKTTGNLPKMVQTLLDTGRCYRLLGNFSKADMLYKDAVNVMEQLPEDAALRAKLIMEQANNAWFQARYEEAFRLQREALELSNQHDLFLIKIISLNTSGLIWWTLGNNDKAMIDLEKALTFARTLPNRKDEVATTLNNMGLVFRETKRYREALNAFDEALAIDTALKSRWAMAYDYRNKALTLLQMGRAKEAVPLFVKAKDEAHAIGNLINEAKALLGLGEAYLAVQNTDAEKAFRDALSLSEAMQIRETQWRAVFGLAKLNLEQDPDAAEKLLKKAVDIIEAMRAEIKIEQLKESFVDNKSSVYETLVSVLINKGKTIEAFEVAERSRARNFIDLLGNQQLSFGNAIDQKSYEKQKSLRRRMDETRMLLARSQDKAEQEIYKTNLKNLTNEYDDLMLDIQARNPELASMITVSPLNAEDLVDKLDNNVALLAYYVLPKEILCWKITHKGSGGDAENITLYRTPLGRDSFGQAILDYRRMIQNLEPLEIQSKELSTWLLSQVLPDLDGITKLGIIPHGPLHYLSFSTLFDGEKYLIDDFSIFYLPSASVWDYTLSRRFKTKNVKVLAIGNPDLGDPLFNLPFAEHEVEAIKWNFPEITVLKGDKATEEWVDEHISEYGIIHMASHGEFDAVNPLFSAIKLSKDDNQDGNLEAAEVFGLKINADMVVLSACQTGLGKITKGDDVIGLNRAFFYAGTHTIVSSLWRVSDVATAVLIKDFYRQYLAHNKADSLRNAMLHVKSRYPHPGYWGAFTLVGDYE